jgi:uncharacterized protein YdcH (DUF465 family)
MLDNEDVNSSDSSAESNQTEQSTPDSNESSSSEASSAAPAQKSEDNVPFHMHPRFQEVISEKNALREQTQALAKQLEQLQSQMKSSQPAQKDELMERLKGIDPAFAERFGKLNEVDHLKNELAEFKQWREQSAAQQLQQQISSSKDKFYTENSVPSDRRDLYEALVNDIAGANPKLTVNDLPAVMKQVHEKLGKMFQSVERSTTKNFVDGKKAEANKPSTMKPGAPAKAVKQDTTPLSRAEILAEMKKEAASSLRADKDI